MKATGALLICLGTTLLLSTAAIGATAHPASGQLTRDPDPEYGTQDYGYPAAYSLGDLTFGGPYPAVDELAVAERYMLAGTRAALNGSAIGLPAWISSIEDFCLDYHARFGVLPPRVTADALRALSGGEPELRTSEQQALVLNPLTGATPRLDAREFAPGDLYVRELTVEEMLHFTERNAALSEAWVYGRYREPGTDRVGRVELLGDVLYVRAYGMHGVIYENLAFRLSEPDFSTVPGTIAHAPVRQPAGDWNDTACTPRG